MKQFKDRLQEKRKALKCSQRDLAAELGVSANTYNRWESGECFPSFFNIIDLANMFGCTTDELMLGEKP